MKVHIFFRRKKCIGCNSCVEAAPMRWQMSKSDGKCNLIDGKEKKGIYRTITAAEEYPYNIKAAANCPVKVIQVEMRQST